MKVRLKILFILTCLLIAVLVLNTNLLAQNYCLNFDGNDYATLGSGLCDSFTDGTEITIEFWFRGTTINSAVRLQNGNSPYIIAGWSYSGNIAFSVSNDGHVVIATPSALQDGNWHHIACTWKANTADGMKTYVDGIFQNQRTTTAAGLPDVNSGGYLGCYAGSSEYINGKLDEVRIWNVVRSQTDIQQNMGESLTGGESGLVAYYKMNQSSGTNIDDATSNEYDATFGTYPEYAPDWSPLDFSGGYGSADAPWQIANLTDLSTLSDGSSYWDECFLQTADIDASSTSTWNSGAGWSPIGTGWDNAFFGTYDGGNYTISGITIERNAGNQGLFGIVRNANIKNMNLTDVTVSITGTSTEGSSYNIGAMIGNSNSSIINNCFVSGTVKGFKYIGGLVGRNNAGTISNCSFEGIVTYYALTSARENLGGLIGYNENNAQIEDCYADITVSGYNGFYAGGLIGTNDASSVLRCYSIGSVGNNYYVGGLVGKNTNSSEISESYSTASVGANSNVAGGLVGNNNGSTIRNCYSRGPVTRGQGSDGSFGSFIGKNENTTVIENCYATGAVIYQNADNPTDKGFIGNYNSTGCSDNFFDSEATQQSGGAGATAKDTDAMKGITPGNTITEWGWSGTVWERIGDNYPRLKDNPDPTLPVTLSTFTAQFLENMPTLYWITQSEMDNIGWFVYRNEEENFTNAEVISELIEGYGTTTQQKFYIYEDNIDNLNVGDTYYYWLESVDFSGVVHHYNRVAHLTISDPLVNPPIIEPPIVYDLKNVPNPVNTSSKFRFTLDKASLVSVSIYNLKGELVRTLPSVLAPEDETSSIYWNGKDENGNELQPGVYLYKLLVNGKIAETKKLILIK